MIQPPVLHEIRKTGIPVMAKPTAMTIAILIATESQRLNVFFKVC